MADIEIGLNKKNISDIDTTVNFDTYGEVVEFESDDIYSISTETSVELNPECIEIEISGLKNIDSFIGLSDTPIYYENGKFFKVVDNKVVYTDITWSDMRGNISENPELEQQIIDIAQIYNEQYVKDVVDLSIEAHNIDTNTHSFIQNIINDNYLELSGKINNGIDNLNKNINDLEEEVVNNKNNINILQEDYSGIHEDVNNLSTQTNNNNILIQNTRQDLKKLRENTEASITKLNSDVTKSNTDISKNAENIQNNYLLISNIFEDLKKYVKKTALSNIAFTGDYNDLNNLPEIPSLDNYATTEYVNTTISESISQIEKFDFVVVNELPEIGESNHIYLVAREYSEGNIYDEYIWIGTTQSFEKIGNTDIDLSNFYNKGEVDSFLNNKVDKIDGYSLILETDIERLGTLHNYDDTEVKNLISTKQDILTAGENVSISKDEETGLTTISAIDTVYTAGEGISIENNIITNTNISAEWGNIVGDINSQVDLQDILNSKIDTDTFNTELNKKQDVLTAGNGITIEENIINGTVITFRDWSV